MLLRRQPPDIGGAEADQPAPPRRRPKAIAQKPDAQATALPQAAAPRPGVAVASSTSRRSSSCRTTTLARPPNLIGQFAAGKPPALDRTGASAARPGTSSPHFGWHAAWYLLNADYLRKTAELIDADQKTRNRIRFLTQQWIDACSPANFLASNPDAQEQLVKTGGESLRSGIANLLGDLGQGGSPRPT